MLYYRATTVFSWAILSVVVATALYSNASAQREESFEGFVSGLRANAVQGEVSYQRKDGRFELEPGLRLEQGDSIKSGDDGFAELLLQPGNYLRIGAETDFHIFSDTHDKMRLKLNEGTITLEILTREFGDFTSFFYTRSQMYELIRVMTPNDEVFITESGIFRINVAGGRTELIVRDGEALINGRRVKEKRRAVSVAGNVTITEFDRKMEDPFDQWGRERAKHLVQANRSLKKESPWAQKRKEGEETTIDLPEDEDEKKTTASLYVVSAKPGTVAFVEPGVQFSQPEKDWQDLTEKVELESGDKVRTDEESFVDLAVLPDMHLRLDRNSEVLFEQLSHEAIVIKLLRGSAILDVARFDRKLVPEIRLAGPNTSVLIADDGNYRLDVRSGSDQIIVRDGKVTLKQRSVGSCNRITFETVLQCAKGHDGFDFWSEHRGEGSLFNGRNYVSMVAMLARIRRAKFRNTGFWFQNPGQTHYTFVPFTATHFRSPYGGNYSTVLTPRRPVRPRIFLGTAPLGVSGPESIRP